MPEINDAEFYVGYHQQAPPGLARRLRATVAVLFALSCAIAVVLVIGQHAFVASRFEFQQYRDYEGTFVAWPYPILRAGGGRDYLLVGQGKHGLTEAPPEADGRAVRLKGAKVEYGPNLMLELLPGSFQPVAGSPQTKQDLSPQGPATLSGEIVDTKCHFGVMNPGRGKVHRDCAVRCISGGIPPGLRVRDASGQTRVYLLTGQGKEILDYVGEPVSVTGEILRQGSLWILKAGRGAIRRE